MCFFKLCFSNSRCLLKILKSFRQKGLKGTGFEKDPVLLKVQSGKTNKNFAISPKQTYSTITHTWYCLLAVQTLYSEFSMLTWTCFQWTYRVEVCCLSACRIWTPALSWHVSSSTMEHVSGRIWNSRVLRQWPRWRGTARRAPSPGSCAPWSARGVWRTLTILWTVCVMRWGELRTGWSLM